MDARVGLGDVGRVLGHVWEHLSRFVLVAGVLLIGVGLVREQVSPTTILEQVVAEYDQARDRNRLVKGYLRLGNELLAIDELDAAQRDFEAALELEPTNPDARRGLFKVELFQSINDDLTANPAIALSRLGLLLTEDPNDPAAHSYLGDVYLVSGDHTKARLHYDAALRANSDFARAYLGKGNLSDLEGKRADALELYEKAAQVAPTNQLFLNNITYQIYRAGDYREAISRYEDLLLIDRRHMLSQYVIASAHRLLGDLDSARYYLASVLRLLANQEARALAPNSNFWFFHLAEPGSEPNVQWLLDYESKTYYARMSLALTIWLQGDRREAMREAARARSIQLLPRDRAALQRLVVFDIATLSKAQPQLASRADSFLRSVFRVSQ